MSEVKISRRYDFDALRGVMMLMGIVLHACVSFTAADTIMFWPYQSPMTSLVFDAIVATIHLFRIPVFFIASGFFLSLLLKKYSLKKVLHKRVKRILVPFVIFFMTIVPLVISLFIRLSNQVGTSDFETIEFLKDPNHWITVHLWFLYYLIIFHTIHFVWNKFKRYLGPQKKLKLLTLYLMIGSFQFFLLLIYGLDTIHGDYKLIPKIESVLYFGFFYFLGTKVYDQLSDFDAWIENWKKLFLLAIVFNTAYLLVMEQVQIIREPSRFFLIIASVLTVLNCNVLILTSFAFFKKFCNRNKRWITKLIDASYTIYVIHLPILIWVLCLIEGRLENPFLMAIVLITATSFLSLLGFWIYRGIKTRILKS